MSFKKVSGKIATAIRIAQKSTKCQEIVCQNDMPVPKGDFYTLYYKRQRIHYSVLALGITMVSIGVFLFKEQNTMKLHFSPPETYETEE